MTSELVSICVPTFNSSAYVIATIESILDQTYPRWELIVADHGSTDNTWEVLQRYSNDPRIQLEQAPPGGGAQANWNRVTNKAHGRYIKLVCADDPLRRDCVERQVAVLESNPDVVLTACQRDIVDASGRVLFAGRGLAGLSGRVSGPAAVRKAVLAGTNIFGEPSCVLFRADALRSAGQWSDALPYVIDLDMYMRVLQHGSFFAIPESMAQFRLSDTSWSGSLARQQSSQQRALQSLARSAFPGAVSTCDVRVGSLRIVANVRARRLVYASFRRRLTTPPRPTSVADLR